MAGKEMSTLFAIAAEYRETAAALADLDLDAQTVADTLEGISGDLDTKARNVAMLIRSIEADASASAQWAKDAAAHSKSLQSRADHLREWLAAGLLLAGKPKITAPGVVISWRASTAVVVDDQSALPEQFMKQPPTPPPTPDKLLISVALKLGENVPGARLDTRENLQIK